MLPSVASAFKMGGRLFIYRTLGYKRRKQGRMQERPSEPDILDYRRPGAAADRRARLDVLAPHALAAGAASIHPAVRWNGPPISSRRVTAQ